MAQKQNHLCGCGCGELLSEVEGIIEEHVWAFVALGNEEKGDSLWRKPCADHKTNCIHDGHRSDKSEIAHTKRLRDRRTQFEKRKAKGGSRMKSKGFRKDIRKRMNGSVEPRER